MARISIRGSILPLVRFLRPISKRARGLPKGWELRPARGSLAHVHHGGARTRVIRPMQAALAKKTGLAPPRLGKVLIIPARPVLISNKAARAASRAVGRHILTGKAVQAEKILKSAAAESFRLGGPGWKNSRDWGRARARRPTLGGAGGRVAAGWQRGRFNEI